MSLWVHSPVPQNSNSAQTKKPNNLTILWPCMSARMDVGTPAMASLSSVYVLCFLERAVLMALCL